MELRFLKKYLNEEGKTYKNRREILRIIDSLIVVSAYFIATILTMKYMEDTNILMPLFIYVIVNSISVSIFKGYSSLWNKSVDREFVQMVIATLIYQIPVALINQKIGYDFPVVFYAVNALLILFLTCSSRIGYRAVRKLIMYMSIDKHNNAKKY